MNFRLATRLLSICAGAALVGMAVPIAIPAGADSTPPVSSTAGYAHITAPANATTVIPAGNGEVVAFQGIPNSQVTIPPGVPAVVHPQATQPIDVPFNVTTTNSFGSTCNWTGDYGNYNGLAFTKITLDSGNCNTTGGTSKDSYVDQVYQANGVNSQGSPMYVSAFNNPIQTLNAGYIVTGEWTIAMENPVGQNLNVALYPFNENAL
jgi:hypothetical protein